MTNTIQTIRNITQRHGIAVAFGLGMLALWSLVGAALLTIAIALCWLAPAALRRVAPEAYQALALDALKRDRFEVVHSVVVMSTDAKLLRQKLERERFQSRRWEDRAKKELLAGDDNEAARCIEQKQKHDARIAKLEPELARQVEAVESARPRAKQFGRDVVGATTEGDLLSVRRRRAQETRNVVLTAAGLRTSAGKEAFERCSGDVARAEAEAQAWEEELGDEIDASVQESAWDEAEREESVATELDALKRKVTARRMLLPGKVG
jgi:phage shock protein A